MTVVFDGFGESSRDSPPKIIPVLPRSAVVTRNGYNMADGFEVTFDADDMPIDPRLIRSGAMELFLFGTKGIAADNRLIDARTGPESEPFGNKPRRSVDTVMREAGGAFAFEEFTLGNNPTIVGLFDDHSFELSSNGRWVTITGQDYTALLLAKQWPPNKKGLARKVPVGKRLDLILGDILREADDTGRLTLKVENVSRSRMPRVAAEFKTQKRGISIDSDTSYFDVMYKMAIRYGFILFVRGLDVVLTTPRNLNGLEDKRIRKMVWGSNIESMEMTRHLGKERTPVCVVKGYNPRTRKTITVDFPHGSFKKITKRTAKKSGKVTTTKTDEYQIFPVYGVVDVKTLRRMAESRYHELGTSEREVNFVTKDMTDYDDRDIMDLSSGDALTIEFAERERELLADENVPAEIKVRHLVARGYGESIAQLIAQKYNELKALSRPMRVREVTYNYSVDSGISIECALQDFIVPGGKRDPDDKQKRKDKRRKNRAGKDIGISRAREESMRSQSNRLLGGLLGSEDAS